MTLIAFALLICSVFAQGTLPTTTVTTCGWFFGTIGGGTSVRCVTLFLENWQNFDARSRFRSRCSPIVDIAVRRAALPVRLLRRRQSVHHRLVILL